MEAVVCRQEQPCHFPVMSAFSSFLFLKSRITSIVCQKHCEDELNVTCGSYFGEKGFIMHCLSPEGRVLVVVRPRRVVRFGRHRLGPLLGCG